eukprot:6984265-Pyramimonas_sp.AAC.1
MGKIGRRLSTKSSARGSADIPDDGSNDMDVGCPAAGKKTAPAGSPKGRNRGGGGVSGAKVLICLRCK